MARLQGMQSWGHPGVAVKLMGLTPCRRYTPEKFLIATSRLSCPRQENTGPLCGVSFESGEFTKVIRKINTKLSVAEGSVVQVAFDLERWSRIASECYPNGVPDPYSDDPNQWIFHGHPCGSVVWDEETKTHRRRPHPDRRDGPSGCRYASARLPLAGGARSATCAWPARRGHGSIAARTSPHSPIPTALVCLSSISGESLGGRPVAPTARRGVRR